MKKIVVCFIVSILISSVAVSAVSASVSFSDLGEFGIPPMTIRRSSAVCDGAVTSAEYGAGVTFASEQGLYLLKSGTVSQDQKPSSATKLAAFANFDGEYIYCALRLQASESITPVAKDFGTCYRVSVSLGLLSDEHPVYCGSLLTNFYYFSSADFSCISFYGERIARSVEGKSVASAPLSSSMEQYRENGITTADGVKWNAAEYCKNAVLSRESDGVFSFEAKIPLEDALLSVHPSRRDDVRTALKNQSGTICGSFTAEIDLNANTSLVAGLPSSVSSEGELLSNWMKNHFPKPASGLFIPKIIPVPLYLCGTPVFNSVENPTQIVESESSAEKDESTSVENALIQTGPVSEQIEVGDSVAAENIPVEDETIFESLPDDDQTVTEKTEIVYETEKYSYDDEEDTKSTVSSIIALCSGILIFFASVVLCIYFRNDNKSDPKKKSNSKKKNSSAQKK